MSWSYVNQDGVVAKLVDPQQIPADVKSIEVGARSVPFMIRTESGTINRAVYWISVLDPTPSSNGWEGVSDGWNENLVYRFGGGCGTTYSQGDALVSAGDGTGTAPTADPDLLSRGYAVATATLNTFQVACNDVLSAETTLMVKEHFIEHYGRPDATIGEGGSGGAIQQLMVAQNYPGLLDALSVSAPFPDAMSIAPGVSDCGLLEHYYSTPAGSTLTSEQRTAINGHATAKTCASWNSSFVGNLDPTTGCDLPPEFVYHPETNPTGARCTLQDSNVNVFGRDPGTGFANRPLDNVGVAYGLEALRGGVISVDQFLDLNARIGGWDIDGNIVAEREVADADDLGRLYRDGRINQGGGDLTHIPIIVTNAYSDPSGDIHDRWRAFQVRERLANGGEAPTNLAIWTVPGGSLGGSLTGGPRDVRNESIDAIQAWLDNLAEVESRPKSAKEWRRTMATTQPVAAMNRCVVSDTLTLTGADVYEGVNSCTHAYPLYGDPRRAAGAGLASVTGKCQLTPVDARAIGVDLTADQELPAPCDVPRWSVRLEPTRRCTGASGADVDQLRRRGDGSAGRDLRARPSGRTSIAGPAARPLIDLSLERPVPHLEVVLERFELGHQLMPHLEAIGGDVAPFDGGEDAATRFGLVSTVGEATVLGIGREVCEGTFEAVVGRPEPDAPDAGCVDQQAAGAELHQLTGAGGVPAAAIALADLRGELDHVAGQRVDE